MHAEDIANATVSVLTTGSDALISVKTSRFDDPAIGPLGFVEVDISAVPTTGGGFGSRHAV